MALQYVILTRPQRDLEDADTILELYWATQMTILTHAPDGKPLHIHADYLKSLKTSGWQGVEQIPAECIVDGRVPCP